MRQIRRVFDGEIFPGCAGPGQIRISRLGAGATFNGNPTRAPSPTTGDGPPIVLVVPSPHWPWSFEPHIQTEPSALTAMLW